MIQVSEKWQKLFESQARYFICTGGRGSAKSFTVTLFLVLLTMEKGQIILFTRYTMISAKLSIIPQFEEVVALLGWESVFDITATEVINKQTGSKIIFKGLKTGSGHQTASLKSLTGVTTWVLDEAEELRDETLFDKINLSIRSKSAQNRVILILNPATSDHWIYSKFFEGGSYPNAEYIHTTFKDNENNLDQSTLDEYERMRLDSPKKYEHIVLGGWLDKAEGVVFENWEIGTFPEHLPKTYSMDFGFSKDPTTLVKVAIDEKRKIIYAHELHYRRDKGLDDVCKILRQNTPPQAEIIADSAEDRLISDVRRRGFNIKEAKKGPGSISAGVKLMEDYKIIVTESSYNLRKELNNYRWSDKRSKNPVDDYNHLIDAIRYVVLWRKFARKSVRYSIT